MSSENLYAPPKAKLVETADAEVSPALWNPNSAANWSLLFSPAFGAYLQMKNWEALGEPAKAATSRIWVVVTLAVLVGLPSVLMFLPQVNAGGGVQRIAGIGLLLGWYFSNGRYQASYVKARFGSDYPRKGWGKPLLFAVLVFVAAILVIGVSAVVAAKLHGGITVRRS